MTRVCLGRVAGGYGTGGLVRVESFTSPPDALFAYALFMASERPFTFKEWKRNGKRLLVRLDSVTTREEADSFRGELYVSRASLAPLEEETYYQADLKGLSVVCEGRHVGVVDSVYNFGGGDLLDIVGLDGKSVMLPFTRAWFPQIHLQKGCLVMVRP